MSATTSKPLWINVKHPGRCQCGRELSENEQARYDFSTQTYIACAGCDPSATPTPLRVVATWASGPEPTPLAGLEQFARRLLPSGDVRRVVDAMIVAGTRAAMEGGAS